MPQGSRFIFYVFWHLAAGLFIAQLASFLIEDFLWKSFLILLSPVIAIFSASVHGFMNELRLNPNEALSHISKTCLFMLIGIGFFMSFLGSLALYIFIPVAIECFILAFIVHAAWDRPLTEKPRRKLKISRLSLPSGKSRSLSH